MTTEFYNHGSVPAANSIGASADVRAEFDAIQSGISAKLPVMAGNALKTVRVNAGETALEAVTATSDAANITNTPAGNIVATTVQSAIDELDVKKPTAKYASSQFDKTSDTSLADITGLSIALEASTSYVFQAVLFFSATNSGGVKSAISYSGTNTAIGFNLSIVNNVALAIVAAGYKTTSGQSAGVTVSGTGGKILIEGHILTNSSGNLTVQFAQNASYANASSVLVGSYLVAQKTS